MSKEDFLKKAKEVHGDLYDYSLVDYKNNKTKVKIICKEHGVFEQRPDCHLWQKQGCPKCFKSIQDNTETFILKAKEVHGDLYDYSLVDYKNNKTKVKIICKEHGVFEQRPDNHLYCKGGCPFCYGTHKKSKESFILDAILIHGDLYDYSLVDYKNNKTKVKIICKEHGVFEQTPLNHIINKNGCYKCGIISIGIKSKEREILSQDEFLKRIKLIHNDLYDYSLVKYKGFRYKIKIICSIHGIFEQLAGNHLNGSGCPICKLSKGENKIKQWLQKYLIKFIFQKRFSGCKNKTELKFDFYLPEYNTCIEYDGELHYKAVNYFGGNEYLKKIQKNDKIKNEYCERNDINLIRIPYWKKNEIEEILKTEVING